MRDHLGIPISCPCLSNLLTDKTWVPSPCFIARPPNFPSSSTVFPIIPSPNTKHPLNDPNDVEIPYQTMVSFRGVFSMNGGWDFFSTTIFLRLRPRLGLGASFPQRNGRRLFGRRQQSAREPRATLQLRQYVDGLLHL